MNFSGKTAVVTGGSRGIGRAICEELAPGGANVELSYAGPAEAPPGARGVGARSCFSVRQSAARGRSPRAHLHFPA